MTTRRRYLFATIATIGLTGCSGPDQGVVNACHQSAVERGKGRDLNQADIGELVEECMSWKGYDLKKDRENCPHDGASALKRGCYYPNSWIGRLIHTILG
jgi:hypothetical protein